MADWAGELPTTFAPVTRLVTGLGGFDLGGGHDSQPFAAMRRVDWMFSSWVGWGRVGDVFNVTEKTEVMHMTGN